MGIITDALEYSPLIPLVPSSKTFKNFTTFSAIIHCWEQSSVGGWHSALDAVISFLFQEPLKHNII